MLIDIQAISLPKFIAMPVRPLDPPRQRLSCSTIFTEHDGCNVVTYLHENKRERDNGRKYKSDTRYNSRKLAKIQDTIIPANMRSPGMSGSGWETERCELPCSFIEIAS